TPVFNHDLQAVAPANRTDRTPDHTKRILAVPARSCHQVLVPAQSIANQPADAIVGFGAGAHALVTAGAAFEIEYQQTLRFHQPLSEKRIHRDVLGRSN